MLTSAPLILRPVPTSATSRVALFYGRGSIADPYIHYPFGWRSTTDECGAHTASRSESSSSSSDRFCAWLPFGFLESAQQQLLIHGIIVVHALVLHSAGMKDEPHGFMFSRKKTTPQSCSRFSYCENLLHQSSNQPAFLRRSTPCEQFPRRLLPSSTGNSRRPPQGKGLWRLKSSSHGY